MASDSPSAVLSRWSTHPDVPWTVGVFGGSEDDIGRLHRRLMPHWTVAPLVENEFLERSLSDCHLVCVFPSKRRERNTTGGTAGVEEIRRIEALAEKLQVPLVILLPDLEPATVIGLRDLRSRQLLVEWSRYGNLSGTLMEIAARPLIESLADRIRSMLASEPILGATLSRVVRQIPPPAPVAVEASDFRFIRKVKELPALAGCSRSHLYAMARAEGLSLGEFLRINTLMHAAALRESETTDEMALRLSFPSAAALRAFLRRELEGSGPERAETSIGFLGETLLGVVGA